MDERPNYDAPRGLAADSEPRRSGRRGLILALGGVVALGLGAALAFGVFRDDPADDTPPPAAEGGLKVELGDIQGGDQFDPARPLRCFVDGRLVGELTVVQCASRNGVAAQNLDVGIDDTGALAAVVAVPGLSTDALGAEVVASEPPEPVLAEIPQAVPAAAPNPQTGECLRHAGDWRMLGEALPLSVCLDVLYAGRCEPPGSAAYGRWNGQTLRLVTGRIEIAADGTNFRTLAEQDPAACAN